MKELLHLRRCDSTQTVARRFGSDGWSLVWSDRQTEGRGRGSRRWISEAGGLYFTLRYPSDTFDVPAPLQTIGAALLWVRVLNRSLDGELDPGIKWPNDLLLRGRKLGGLLGESHGDALLLGIGINVNNTFQDQEGLRHPPISLREATGETHSRRALLFNWVSAWLRAAEMHDHADLFASDEIEERLRTLGKYVRTERSRGRATGLAPDGGLVLETNRGTRTVHAGDVVEVPYG